MTKASFNPGAVPNLAAQIRVNWAAVSRDMNGIKQLQRFRDMGRKRYLTKAELREIGEAKSSRLKALLSENSEDFVQNVTRQAFAATSERERIRLLCSLRGVAVPRASALLSWTHPERWPVIDQRAWRTLLDHKVVTGRVKGTNLGILQWEYFVKAVAHLQRELSDRKLTPQQIDRILYQMDADKNRKKRESRCC